MKFDEIMTLFDKNDLIRDVKELFPGIKKQACVSLTGDTLRK